MAAAVAAAPKQRFQGVQKESAGYKLLASMGWKEGEGLGASKQGIKEHIRVKKNYENWGVGAVQAADRARDWSTGMVEFHRVLSTLSEVTSQHASRRSGGAGDSSDEESDASDGELPGRHQPAPTNGSSEAAGKAKTDSKKSKRKASRDAADGAVDAGEAKPSKKKKVKKSKAGDEPAVTTAAAPAPAAAEAAPAPAVQRVKAATHLGRFKRRESAKTVKHYSHTDLAAILGGDPFAAAAAACTEVRSQAAAEPASGSDEEGNALPAGTGRQGGAGAAALEEEVVDVSGLWWSGYFTRSGRMGSLQRAKRDPSARGFSEQDQADLYNAAHDGKTQGRVGLGRSGMPKKVGGVRWEGKRTKLGSDSEDEGGSGSGAEEEEQAAAAAAPLEEQAGIVIVMPASHRQRPAAAPPAEPAEPAAGKEELAAVDWEAAAVAALKASGKSRLKVAKLHKAVIKARGVQKRHKGEAARLVTRCVEASAAFVVADGVVRLAL